MIARTLGVLNLGSIGLDGSKINVNANASKHSVYELMREPSILRFDIAIWYSQQCKQARHVCLLLAASTQQYYEKQHAAYAGLCYCQSTSIITIKPSQGNKLKSLHNDITHFACDVGDVMSVVIDRATQRYIRFTATRLKSASPDFAPADTARIDEYAINSIY